MTKEKFNSRVAKLETLCASVEGFQGVVRVGHTLAIATLQRDCGEGKEAPSVKPLKRFVKTVGLKASICPFPTENGLVYVLKIRRD